MTSNRDWLFSLPLDEQLAWMNAEHVEGVEIQGEVCEFEHEADSREKLYADIDHWLGSWMALSVQTSTIKEAVLGWLDRQESITERALHGYVNEHALKYKEQERFIVEQERELEKYRDLAGDLLDAAHNMQLIADRGLA